jgi:hypothetical protein
MKQTIYQTIAPLFIGRRFRVTDESGESRDDEAVTVADIRFDHERWGVPGVYIVLIDEYGIEYPFEPDMEIAWADEPSTDTPPAVGEEWRDTTNDRVMTIQEIDERNAVVILRSDRSIAAMPIMAFLERFVRVSTADRNWSSPI